MLYGWEPTPVLQRASGCMRVWICCNRTNDRPQVIRLQPACMLYVTIHMNALGPKRDVLPAQAGNAAACGLTGSPGLRQTDCAFGTRALPTAKEGLCIWHSCPTRLGHPRGDPETKTFTFVSPYAGPCVWDQTQICVGEHCGVHQNCCCSCCCCRCCCECASSPRSQQHCCIDWLETVLALLLNGVTAVMTTTGGYKRTVAGGGWLPPTRGAS